MQNSTSLINPLDMSSCAWFAILQGVPLYLLQILRKEFKGVGEIRRGWHQIGRKVLLQSFQRIKHPQAYSLQPNPHTIVVSLFCLPSHVAIAVTFRNEAITIFLAERLPSIARVPVGGRHYNSLAFNRFLVVFKWRVGQMEAFNSHCIAFTA